MRTIVLLITAVALGHVALAQETLPDPVASCEGVADGVRCLANDDGCTANDGFDRCLSGRCASPPPCDRTHFLAKRKGSVGMSWQKDPSKVTPGEYCVGQAFVKAALIRQLTGAIVPPDDGDQVIITRSQGAQRTVPPSGQVDMTLRLNRLGRLLLARSRGTLSATARMTLNAPQANPPSVGSANREMVLRELVRKLRK